MLAHATKHPNVSPADLWKVLSSTMTWYPGMGTTPKPTDAELIVVNGKKCRSVNVTARYSISAHRSSKSGALVDQGANGGVTGDEVRIIFKTGRHVDIRGINDHQIIDIPIVTCAGGVIFTQRGPVIAIMHQYAYTGKGKSIHSWEQLEWYKNDVNDKSIKVPGGPQRIQTNDGYAIPINVKDGLP
jgi:hypothetical protein